MPPNSRRSGCAGPTQEHARRETRLGVCQATLLAPGLILGGGREPLLVESAGARTIKRYSLQRSVSNSPNLAATAVTPYAIRWCDTPTLSLRMGRLTRATAYPNKPKLKGVNGHATQKAARGGRPFSHAVSRGR